MPEITRTGIFGLGQMGRGIARNLDTSELLRAAHDIAGGAFEAASLSSRVLNSTPEEMLERCDVVFFAVPTTAQIASVIGDLHAPQQKIIVDLTTSDPKQSAALADELKPRGFSYVDAAMTGGATGADCGTLTLMLGGEEQDIARCRPALEVIASHMFHLGPVGSGHAMKLIHNLILHSSYLVTCEGLRLAQRVGIDLELANQVLNAGNARSFVTETRFPRDILSGTMNARSRIANLEKDLALAQHFARQLDGRAPYCNLTQAILAQAVSSGHAETDFSWLFPRYEELVDQLESKDEH